MRTTNCWGPSSGGPSSPDWQNQERPNREKAMIDIKLGEYVEIIIEYIAQKLAPVFDGLTVGIETLVTGFQNVLTYLHPFIMMGLFAVFAYLMLARKQGIFTKQGWQ